MTAILTRTISTAVSTYNTIGLRAFNPLRILRAFEHIYRMRQLDDAALRDMGLTRAAVEKTTLAEVLKNPHL